MIRWERRVKFPVIGAVRPEISLSIALQRPLAIGSHLNHRGDRSGSKYRLCAKAYGFSQHWILPGQAEKVDSRTLCPRCVVRTEIGDVVGNILPVLVRPEVLEASTSYAKASPVALLMDINQ
jgi:hypothetical protein